MDETRKNRAITLAADTLVDDILMELEQESLDIAIDAKLCDSATRDAAIAQARAIRRLKQRIKALANEGNRPKPRKVA